MSPENSFCTAFWLNAAEHSTCVKSSGQMGTTRKVLLPNEYCADARGVPFGPTERSVGTSRPGAHDEEVAVEAEAPHGHPRRGEERPCVWRQAGLKVCSSGPVEQADLEAAIGKAPDLSVSLVYRWLLAARRGRVEGSRERQLERARERLLAN
eukprot:scaffold276513_cov24-Tisochrysis_lutea.AAC.1